MVQSLFISYSRAKKVLELLIKVNYSTKVRTPTDGIAIRGDIVGPPNPISNIRPITFHIPKNETSLEKVFRLKREDVQKWHEEFWSQHNLQFTKERKEFEKNLKANRPPGGAELPLTADEISVFYKSFLDKHWKTHFWYNIEWYRHNLTLLSLAFRVEINRFKNKFLSK